MFLPIRAMAASLATRPRVRPSAFITLAVFFALVFMLYKFYYRHLCSIGFAGSELDHPGIAAVHLLVLRSDNSEKFAYFGRAVAETGSYQALLRDRIYLGMSDQLFYERT